MNLGFVAALHQGGDSAPLLTLRLGLTKGPLDMNEERKELFRNLGLISSMGISVVVAIALGVYAGLWLDRKFGTNPWFFYIFLFFGIAAGFRNIQIMTAREIRRDERDDA